MDGKNICQTDAVKSEGQGEIVSSNNSEVPMVTDDDCQGQSECEGQTEVEGQNILPGVKRMIYCQDLSVIAVIYYG